MNNRSASPGGHGWSVAWRENLWSLLIVIWIVSLTFAWVSGRLTPHYVDDSPSYIQFPFDSMRSALLSIRTPGYPFLIRVFGVGAMPTVACLINGLAAWALAVQLRRYGATMASVWASAATIVFSCTALDHQSTIASDAVTASLGILLVALLLRWNRRGRPWIGSAMMAATGFAVIMFRPAAIGLIAFVFLAGVLVGRIRPADSQTPARSISWSRAIVSSLIPATAVSLLLIGWMTLRWVYVNDFGVLPFGHQNLSGLTVQLVGDDELLQVSPPSRELVEAYLRHRHQSAKRGFVLADPLSGDSSDAASTGYQAGMTSATMTIESRWNDLIYQAMVPASCELIPDDPVARHRAISRLNMAIVKTYPDRYVRWIALAIRRACWGSAANWLLNPFFLLMVLLAILWNLWRAIRGRAGVLAAPSDATRILWVVAVTFAATMIGFVILTSPPLGRFADAGAILLPTWIASRFAEVLGSEVFGAAHRD